MQHQHISAGSFHVGSAQSIILEAYLGTCVGVALFDPDARVRRAGPLPAPRTGFREHRLAAREIRRQRHARIFRGPLQGRGPAGESEGHAGGRGARGAGRRHGPEPRHRRPHGRDRRTHPAGGRHPHRPDRDRRLLLLLHSPGPAERGLPHRTLRRRRDERGPSGAAAGRGRHRAGRRPAAARPPGRSQDHAPDRPGGVRHPPAVGGDATRTRCSARAPCSWPTRSCSPPATASSRSTTP